MSRIQNYIEIEGKRYTVRFYDYGDSAFDRYTAVYSAERKRWSGERYYPYLSMSENPLHPQGFGQHGEMSEIGRHLGKRITFDELPEDCKRAVIQDLTA